MISSVATARIETCSLKFAIPMPQKPSVLGSCASPNLSFLIKLAGDLRRYENIGLGGVCKNGRVIVLASGAFLAEKPQGTIQKRSEIPDSIKSMRSNQYRLINFLNFVIGPVDISAGEIKH